MEGRLEGANGGKSWGRRPLEPLEQGLVKGMWAAPLGKEESQGHQEMKLVNSTGFFFIPVSQGFIGKYVLGNKDQSCCFQVNGIKNCVQGHIQVEPKGTDALYTS